MHVIGAAGADRPWAFRCALACLLGSGGGFKAHAHERTGAVVYIKCRRLTAQAEGLGHAAKGGGDKKWVALDEGIRKWLARVISNLPR